MKILKLSALIFLSLAFTTPTVEKKDINLSESSIHWKGTKLTGEHSGNILFKKGYLEFENNKLKGGTFEVDMNSLNATDVEGESKQDLDKHLKSDDFFGVKKYPTSSLVFMVVKEIGKDKYSVTADLTIKSVTKTTTFDMVVSPKEQNATAKLSIDRTKYGVRYGSKSFFDNLGDKVINDIFEVTVSLKYK